MLLYKRLQNDAEKPVRIIKVAKVVRDEADTAKGIHERYSTTTKYHKK